MSIVGAVFCPPWDAARWRPEVEDDLDVLFAEAARLAGRVPSPMQGAAFTIAFGRLSPQQAASSRPAVQTPSSSRPVAGRVARARTVTSSKRGPKAALEQLSSEGFFDIDRSPSEAREHLRERGWVYEAKGLATGFLRLVRDGGLTRRRTPDGQFVYRRPGI